MVMLICLFLTYAFSQTYLTTTSYSDSSCTTLTQFGHKAEVVGHCVNFTSYTRKIECDTEWYFYSSCIPPRSSPNSNRELDTCIPALRKQYSCSADLSHMDNLLIDNGGFSVTLYYQDTPYGVCNETSFYERNYLTGNLSEICSPGQWCQDLGNGQREFIYCSRDERIIREVTTEPTPSCGCLDTGSSRDLSNLVSTEDVTGICQLDPRPAFAGRRRSFGTFCRAYNYLVCEPEYYGSDCDEVLCLDGTWSNDTAGCGGHGTCYVPGAKCICDSGYGGETGDDCANAKINPEDLPFDIVEWFMGLDDYWRYTLIGGAAAIGLIMGCLVIFITITCICSCCCKAPKDDESQIVRKGSSSSGRRSSNRRGSSRRKSQMQQEELDDYSLSDW